MNIELTTDEAKLAHAALMALPLARNHPAFVTSGECLRKLAEAIRAEQAAAKPPVKEG